MRSNVTYSARSSLLISTVLTTRTFYKQQQNYCEVLLTSDLKSNAQNLL